MHHKKLFCLLVFTTLAIAQNYETLNVYGSIGFGIPTGGQLYPSIKTNQDVVVEEKDSYFNFGRGLKLDLGAQYFVMENIAIQAGLGISGNVPRLKTFNETSDLKENTTYRSSLWGLKALVVPHFELLELVTMYTGVGIGFFWNSMKYERKDETIMGGEVISSVTTKGKIKTSPKFAFLGLAGVNYPLTDLISLYGEVAFEQMSFTIKKQVEGNNTIVFEKDSNLPSPVRIPGSNWQLRLGVRYSVL